MPYKNEEDNGAGKEITAKNEMRSAERNACVVFQSQDRQQSQVRPPKTGWKAMLGLAVGIGVVLLAALGWDSSSPRRV
jgi:hypothetical protein